MLAALGRLTRPPDLILFDGQGIAHPRGIGLASHLGLWLDLPTIGCAKTRLCGTFDPVDEAPGSRSELRMAGRVVGTVLRTKRRTNPLFVSPGHRIAVETAAAVVLACCRNYRLPEPTRRAHLLVNRLRRGEAPVIDGEGKQSMDFIHVHDIARAVVLALDCASDNVPVNIGTGIDTTVAELARILIDAVGVDALDLQSWLCARLRKRREDGWEKGLLAD